VTSSPSAQFDIKISNLQTCLLINESRLREIVQICLTSEQVKEAEISIAILDNEEIWGLNRQFLDHDYPTDVLSFLLEENSDGSSVSGDIPLGAGKQISGEVIVSAEMAKETSPEYGWSPIEELYLYTVHGLLHLCGYDDHNDDDRQTMRSQERHVLSLCGIQPPKGLTEQTAS